MILILKQKINIKKWIKQNGKNIMKKKRKKNNF